MKKKIKDLTREDITNICDKYWNCQQCPLYNPYGLEDCILEQEVEIDESDND